ncbi:MAG: hypothetical protein HAW59_05020 [Betaproteobacteria bacterium]|nr:hypothetical protein [Betaproteobacteria bacterium]
MPPNRRICARRRRFCEKTLRQREKIGQRRPPKNGAKLWGGKITAAAVDY